MMTDKVTRDEGQTALPPHEPLPLAAAAAAKATPGGEDFGGAGTNAGGFPMTIGVASPADAEAELQLAPQSSGLACCDRVARCGEYDHQDNSSKSQPRPVKFAVL
jgi:hypothetical protein